MSDTPRRKRIPIRAAQDICHTYGFDQVVIYARNHSGPNPGEHFTTYGRTQADRDVAARMSQTLQRFMGWTPDSEEPATNER